MTQTCTCNCNTHTHTHTHTHTQRERYSNNMWLIISIRNVIEARDILETQFNWECTRLFLTVFGGRARIFVFTNFLRPDVFLKFSLEPIYIFLAYPKPEFFFFKKKKKKKAAPFPEYRMVDPLEPRKSCREGIYRTRFYSVCS